MIAQETIDAIKEQVSLATVAGEHVELKRKGSTLSGCCPFHDEKTPSFFVREDDGYFHCFGCGESGNVITFVMRMLGLSFPDAIESLASRFGIEVKRVGARNEDKDKVDKSVFYHANNLALKYFTEALKKAPDSVINYLKTRELSKKIVREYSIGYAPNSSWDALVRHLRANKLSDQTILAAGLARRSPKGDLYDLFRGRLIFPVFVDRQRVVAFGGRLIPGLFDDEKVSRMPKYLNSPETPVYRKAKILYALPQAMNAIRQKKQTLLVEGYMDVAGLAGAGITNCVATCGTAVTTEHIERLARFSPVVKVIFDGDLAGRNAAAKTFELFLNSGVDVKALFLPEGEDPDTIAKKYGDKTEEYLNSLEATPLIDAFLEAEFRKLGIEDITKAGASAKARLAEQLTLKLALVENNIERHELIKAGAFKLMVDSEQLNELLLDLKNDSQGKKTGFKPPVEELNSVHFSPVPELPKVDQELLIAVMAQSGERRRTMISRLLSDPDLCLDLHPSTRLFIESINPVFADDKLSPEEQKASVHQLLLSFGPSWLNHWRKAFRMAADPEVNLSLTFDECCQTLRRAHLRRGIDELNRLLGKTADEEQQQHLIAERISLERRLRNF